MKHYVVFQSYQCILCLLPIYAKELWLNNNPLNYRIQNENICFPANGNVIYNASPFQGIYCQLIYNLCDQKAGSLFVQIISIAFQSNAFSDLEKFLDSSVVEEYFDD